MIKSSQNLLKAVTLSAALFPFAVQSDVVNLIGTLSAANQNGSDPSVVVDPLGVVPTDANGIITMQLNDEANTLDIQLGVIGITLDDLLDFGPNQSPIHLHNAGGGNPGNFGPIAIDPTFTANGSNYIGNADGFAFSRDGVSILLAAQGNVQGPNMHPGDDKIVDALLSGNMFVAVHTNKPIFENAPDGRPLGFPFVEIRGNFSPEVVPVPAALPLLGSGLLALVAFARRRKQV